MSQTVSKTARKLFENDSKIIPNTFSYQSIDLEKKKSMLKKILIGVIPALITLYFITAFICSKIAVNSPTVGSKSIFLSTNGIHLDIILPTHQISEDLKSDIDLNVGTKYVSFGWGDKDFYLKTPTWGDLTFSTAFKAMFLKSETLMHLTYYENPKKNWIKINISAEQLQSINKLINESFKNIDHHKILIPNSGYSKNDEFFQANGSYSCLFTCNSWVNSILKNSNIPACLWTPFDSQLLDLHQ